MKNIRLLVLLCFASFALSSCGVKPSHVDPPQGKENNKFPRTYPDPATDPR